MKEQLVKEYKRETNASFVDGLTGLYNHGIFQILLEEEINRSQRYEDPFSLAMIDIDLFSFYNKQHDHLTGDRALKMVAKSIKENIRNTDMASRFSGDVFAVIFPKVKVRSAYTVLERVRRSVETHSNGTLSISVGIASCPEEASSRENLILKAQEALLQAKGRGKNKVCFLEEVNEPAVQQRSKILVVDDDPRNVKLLEALLLPFNHEIFKAYNGEEALSILRKIDINLVLLDIMMPHMDGYEVCRRLKNREATRLVPVVMITALDDTEARVKGIESGADDFITKPPNKVELTARVTSLLKVNMLNRKLTSIENVLISMANAVEAKDPYTEGHTQRVADLAVALGKRMGLSETETDALRLGGILHDIGKIGVPREILNKPGRLDAEEFEVIKRHSHDGYRICLPLQQTLGPALEAIRHHHEKIDGSGYPDGIKGEEISVLSRILAVVDIFDALITDRPYRKGMSMEQTFKILGEESGEGKLDKKVVETLMDIVNR